MYMDLSQFDKISRVNYISKAGRQQDTQCQNDEYLAQTTWYRTMKELRNVGKTWVEIKASARDTEITEITFV